jgi:hypothetical protein
VYSTVFCKLPGNNIERAYMIFNINQSFLCLVKFCVIFFYKTSRMNFHLEEGRPKGRGTLSSRFLSSINNVRPHKKNSWLASSPAHKKRPRSGFFKIFYLKKPPTFIDQRALTYVYFC